MTSILPRRRENQSSVKSNSIRDGENERRFKRETEKQTGKQEYGKEEARLKTFPEQTLHFKSVPISSAKRP